MPKKPSHSCSECGLLNCYRRDQHFPDFCLTEGADREVVGKVTKIYHGKSQDAVIARAAAEV